MATKVKGGPPTKEKRGTSPAHPLRKDTIQRGKSTSTTKAASPAKRSNSTSPSRRQLPNYLKPTISSGLDSSTHHVKKNSPGESLKPSISRRRSLEKPLPPSHVPKTRATVPNRDTKTRPSPASVVKVTASAKPLAGRAPKARSVSGEKGSRNDIKKPEKEVSGLPTKQPMLETVDNFVPQDTPQIEAIEEKEEDLASSITQIDEDPEEKDEIGPRAVVMEDNNEHINIEPEAEVVKMVQSLVESKDKDESLDPTTMEQEENIKENEVTIDEHEELGKNLRCMEESTPDQVLAKAIEEMEEEEGKENFSIEKEKGGGEGSQHIEIKESETVNDDVKEERHGGENVAVRRQVVQGKRDSVVSNDVIEETATKLREQRKNKVKALAGAFETVISIQETK